MNEEQPVNAILTEKELQARLSPAQRCQQIESGQQSPQLLHRLLPPWHLAVFGGGVDARPVVALAAELGWQITLCDPRIVNNRAANFHPSVRIIRQAIEQQKQESWIGTVDAVLILTHNIDLDAQALQLVQHSSARYTGLLGPEHRTKRVLAHADLTQEQLTTSLASPVGLRLGGELPESIALAMVAEVHAFLHQADGQSMSHILSNNS